MAECCKCPLCGERTTATTNDRLWALERLARAAVALDALPGVVTSDELRVKDEYDAALEEVRKWV